MLSLDVEKLRDQIDELEETVRQLTVLPAKQEFQLPAGVRLSPTHLAILAALHRHTELSTEAVWAVVTAVNGGNGVSKDLVSVHLHRMRKVLSPVGVTITKASRWGDRYALSAESRAVVAAWRVGF